MTVSNEITSILHKYFTLATITETRKDKIKVKNMPSSLDIMRLLINIKYDVNENKDIDLQQDELSM